MLSWNIVLKYCKANLALPSTFVENTEKEMREYLIDTALVHFSSAFPDWERVPIYVDETRYKVSGKDNWYYILDEEDLDIIGIKECYFNLEEAVTTSHPVMGPMSFSGMKWWSLEVFKSKFFDKFSHFNKTYRFIEPNMIEVLPQIDDPFVVEYERYQPKDLSRIPAAMRMQFMDLCLGCLMIKLGNMRSHYGDGRIVTPFGEIPLQGEDLRTRGMELRDKVMQELDEQTIPAMYIDIN